MLSHRNSDVTCLDFICIFYILNNDDDDDDDDDDEDDDDDDDYDNNYLLGLYGKI